MDKLDEEPVIESFEADKAAVRALAKGFEKGFSKRIEAISFDVASGAITNEEGKKRSAELRKENPTLHAAAMKSIGALYGFDKENERENKQTKLQKAALKKRPAWLKPVKKPEEPQAEEETNE